MSDKTREEYEAKFRKPTSIEWNLEHKRYLGCGDERIKSLAQGYSYGYEVWQAAHEMYAPKWISSKERAPQKPGLENYEHVYCWVVKDGNLLERPWNCEHECFDDEDGDDWFCDLADTEFWMEKVVPSLPKQEQDE